MMKKHSFKILALAMSITTISCIKFEDKDAETDAQAIDTLAIEEPEPPTAAKEEITDAVMYIMILRVYPKNLTI